MEGFLRSDSLDDDSYEHKKKRLEMKYGIDTTDDKPLSEYEIERVIKTFNPKKAPGRDKKHKK